MVIKFNSDVSEVLKYDIYVNSTYIKSICLSPNQTTKTIELDVDDAELELSIIPCKVSFKKSIYNLLKKIILLPITMFLSSVTREPILISEKDFYIKSRKTVKIKNQNSGQINFNITCGKIKNKKSIYSLKINIVDFNNLIIAEQTSDLMKDIKDIKNQFREWSLFYFLFFMPIYILLFVLFNVSAKKEYYIILAILLIIFAIVHILLNLRCFRIFLNYKSYLTQGIAVND